MVWKKPFWSATLLCLTREQRRGSPRASWDLKYFHWMYVRKVNKAKYNRALLILRRTRRLCSFLFSQRQTLWHIRHLELLHPSNKKTQKPQNHYLLLVKKAKWKKSQSSLFVKACWRKIFKYISQKSVFFNTCYNESF